MERGQEDLLDQIGSKLAPAAMPEHDLRMRKNWYRARPKDGRRRLFSAGLFHFLRRNFGACHDLGGDSIRRKRRGLCDDLVQRFRLEMPPVGVVRGAS